MRYTLPSDVDERPVAIDGVGTLGRRIGAVYGAGGTDVHIVDLAAEQPPELNSVELMSSGQTDESLIDALMERIPRYGLAPFRVRRESDGFIFNRVWAAIKRECLMVVAEGVATPEDVDGMWMIFTKPG